MPVGLTPLLILVTVAPPVPSPPEIPHETSVIEGVLLGVQGGTATVRCDDGRVLRFKVDPNVRARLSGLIGWKVKIKVVNGVIVDVTPLAPPTEREHQQPDRKRPHEKATTRPGHPRGGYPSGGTAVTRKGRLTNYLASRSTAIRVSSAPGRAASGEGVTGAGGYGRGAAPVTSTRSAGAVSDTGRGVGGVTKEVGKTEIVSGAGTASPPAKSSAEGKAREHPSNSARVMERERSGPVVSGWESMAALIIAVTLIATVGLYLYRRGLPARTHLYQTHSAT